MRAMNNNNDMI